MTKTTEKYQFFNFFLTFQKQFDQKLKKNWPFFDQKDSKVPVILLFILTKRKMLPLEE